VTKAAESLKLQLSLLSLEDRAELAHFLIDSLEGEEDADREAAWNAELARRGAEIQSGQAEGQPAHEVFSELRKKYT
jgi:putative addiction module component (TIGR02574 family)